MVIVVDNHRFGHEEYIEEKETAKSEPKPRCLHDFRPYTQRCSRCGITLRQATFEKLGKET